MGVAANPTRWGLMLDGTEGVVATGGGQERIRLEVCTAGSGAIGGWNAPDAAAAGDKFPHVRAAGYTCLRLPAGLAASPHDLARFLKFQLGLVVFRSRAGRALHYSP